MRMGLIFISSLWKIRRARNEPLQKALAGAEPARSRAGRSWACFLLWSISYLGSHSQTILKDNYRSVLAAQRMKEAIERMDSAALFHRRRASAKKESSRRTKYRPIFEAELKVQEGNITEAGEKEFTEGLRAAWTDYQAKFDRLQKTASADEARRLYFSELEAAFYKVKAAADEILAINQDTMVRKSDDVRRTAERMNAITHYGGAGGFGAGTLGLDVVDPPHVAAAVGAQRGDAQNRRRQFRRARPRARATTSWRTWRTTSTPWRRAWRNIAKAPSETCCKLT